MVVSDPVKESSNIYDAFIEKERSSIPIRTDDKSVKGDPKVKAKKSPQAKKKAQETRPNKKITLEMALEKVSNVCNGYVLLLYEFQLRRHTTA